MLKVYARETVEGKYPNGLAYSVHLGIVREGVTEPLHQNYGILFPKARIDERNVIVPSYVRNIKVSKSPSMNRYWIVGEDVLPDGTLHPDREKCLWCWSTEDFISFEEMGLVETDHLRELSGLSVEALKGSDEIAVPEEWEDRLRQYWNPLTFQDIQGDTVRYSDGSCHKKNLKKYPSLKFPLARGFGDPVILLWKDMYYFIATNDNLEDIGLYVRKAAEPDDLFRDDTPMHLILDKDEKRGLIQTFWAPEFHIIGGDLYILFAVSNENWGPQCHMMRLKEGGDILKAEDWEDPIKVMRADGTPLGENGITLDMTYVPSGDRHYYVWSYREHIGTPLDSGSMLMVAEFSPHRPDRLISQPVCISRPLYGFENTSGTINNEGPYAFCHEGTIYLAYSGGDARGYLYTIGMLTARFGADLCDAEVWTKEKTPVLSFASVPGEYGPGHNSFFRDREGDLWIAFHATGSYEERVISSGIRRVHMDATGRPRFDLAREEDLPERYRE